MTIPEGLPAAALEFVVFDPFAAETEPASGAEVGEHVVEENLIPRIRAEEGGHAHAAEQDPDIVILIESASRVGRPGEQTSWGWPECW